MDIELSSLPLRGLTFADLSPGDVFRHSEGGLLFMKMRSDARSMFVTVEVRNGAQWTTPPESSVTRVAGAFVERR